jgi:hypothetical protein
MRWTCAPLLGRRMRHIHPSEKAECGCATNATDNKYTYNFMFYTNNIFIICGCPFITSRENRKQSDTPQELMLCGLILFYVVFLARMPLAKI